MRKFFTRTRPGYWSRWDRLTVLGRNCYDFAKVLFMVADKRCPLCNVREVHDPKHKLPPGFVWAGSIINFMNLGQPTEIVGCPRCNPGGQFKPNLDALLKS